MKLRNVIRCSNWWVVFGLLFLIVTVACGGGGGGSDEKRSSDFVIQYDEGADGTVDAEQRLKFNAAGHIEELLIRDLTTGSIEDIGRFSFDDAGRCVEGRWGLPVEDSEFFTYDVDGRLVLYEEDDGDDGIIDECTAYTYDANDLVIREDRDFDCDGSIEDFKTYTWNASGNIIRKEETWTGGTGAVSVTTYEYDTSGNMTTMSEDWNDDGGIDGVQTWTWSAGADGTENVENLVLYDNAGFRPELMYEYANMLNHLESIEEDYDNDGTIDVMERFYYNAAGKVSRHEDYDNDGGTMVIDMISTVIWP